MARLLRTSTNYYRPIRFLHSSSSSSCFVKCVSTHQSSKATSLNSNNGDNTRQRKPVVAVKAASVAAKINKPWNNILHPEMLIERAIIDCRFFTLLAVAGSLLGSLLCFVEGCVLVVECYGHYFHTLGQRLDQHHLVQLLIEAIDMFLVGTALLVFGAGLYTMFVGSRTTNNNKKKEKDATSMHSESNILDLFYTKTGGGPGWVGMQSIEEAKSKIGHAVMMIVQVGILEKLKDIPLVTAIDLASFAAVLLTSSASIFVLSKLYS
ncbi:hypothetical protein HN51_037778 [Arachis hypogaea]|uniref:Uncharacterized protein n=1 Tax=Arachis hypogaea TaxID=3818 RepID=A0A444ZUH7_ARAHY|nr:uncharacterized protein LOC112791968 isoform X1 [Arachis hypogaea]QHO03388.1 uncharacterized protein DS421_13g431800 [Arachis hypogaea]RYR17839.1 hypothetical protein Ahy_B03g062512 [Arachis hypogaea]